MQINKELTLKNNLICNLHYLFFIVFFCLISFNSILADYHIVRKGENFKTIAANYGVSVKDILRMNNLNIKSKIYPGQKLRISNQNINQKIKTSAQKTKIHIVGRKDTLFSISKQYKVSIGEIKRLNNMASDKVFLGQRLKISLDNDYVKSPAKEYILSWPIRGRIKLGYGIKNLIPHKGIDIECQSETSIKAALSGEIKYVGFFQSLENFIIIKHDDHVSTVYGNLGETLVKVGDQVSEGDIIGKTVKKESSSHSFLHFEIRFNTVPKNPLFFLKK